MFQLPTNGLSKEKRLSKVENVFVESGSGQAEAKTTIQKRSYDLKRTKECLFSRTKWVDVTKIQSSMASIGWILNCQKWMKVAAPWRDCLKSCGLLTSSLIYRTSRTSNEHHFYFH